MKTADSEDHLNKKGLPQAAEIRICDSHITLNLHKISEFNLFFLGLQQKGFGFFAGGKGNAVFPDDFAVLLGNIDHRDLVVYT